MYGGAIYANESTVQLTGEIKFLVNVASLRSGGSITLKRGAQLFLMVAPQTSITVFDGNKARDYGGAVLVDHSKLHFSSYIQFSKNSAAYGGALAFIKGYLTMTNNTSVTIVQNYADMYGGGVYVDDDAYYSWEETECFVSCIHDTCFNSIIKFDNNKALSAGECVIWWVD